MATTLDITPRTQQTAGVGFDPNIAVVGYSNPEWVQNAADNYAQRWANSTPEQRLTMMPQGWISGTEPGYQGQGYGEPEPSDQGGKPSAKTQMAFIRYFQNYKPGKDPYIDQTMPYIPPKATDYIESPTTIATRMAAEQWSKEFDEKIRQANIVHDDATAARIATAKANAATIFNNAFQNEITKYSTQSENYRAQEDIKQRNYNTQADIYTKGEALRGSNLANAGSLAQALQAAYDERTNKAIGLQANPGDFIERESAVRALNAPQGINVPAYKNVDALQEVINKLINYVPGKAPEAPTPASAEMTRPTVPDQGTWKPPPSLQEIINQLTNTGAGTSTGGAPVVSPASNHSWYTPPAENTVPASTAGVNHVAGGPINLTTGERIPGMAMGGTGVMDRQMIAGDPQVQGIPNPEMITINNPGPNTTTSITPLHNALRQFAYGTDPAESDLMLKSYPDSAYQDYPTLKYMQGRMGALDYNKLSTGSATGAFGARIPESGAINYGKYLNIAKDPISLALLSSSYRSASRDLLSEVARAKSRAPFGQAVQTSLIRT